MSNISVTPDIARFLKVRVTARLITYQLLTFYFEGKWEWDYAEPTAVDTPGDTKYQSVKDTKYTPRDRSANPPVSLPPVDEDALEVEEPIHGNYRHDEGVSDLSNRMAETSIGSYSEGHQYSSEHQYPTDQQYPEGYQYAEGNEYEDYEGYGDKRREKGSSQPQDRRRRDKKRGSSSKAEDNKYGMKKFADSPELN
jgi:hypothetical protein